MPTDAPVRDAQTRALLDEIAADRLDQEAAREGSAPTRRSPLVFWGGIVLASFVFAMICWLAGLYWLPR